MPLSSRSNTLCTLFDFKISGLSHLRSGKKANRKLMGRLMSVWRAYSLHVVQLNKYETAPNLIQLSQNLTSNCLLISVFLPVFAWCDHNIVLQIKTKQFYDHIMQKLVKTGKNKEINKQSDVNFWLDWRKYGSNCLIAVNITLDVISDENLIWLIL